MLKIEEINKADLLECRYCHKPIAFLSASVLYGVIFLFGKKQGYYGTVCPTCGKTNLMRSSREDSESVKTALDGLGGAVGLDSELLRYYAVPRRFRDWMNSGDMPEICRPILSQLISRETIEKSDLGFQGFMDYLMRDNETKLETECPNTPSEVYSTYFFGDMFLGPAMTVYYFKENSIEALLEEENRTGNKLMPRYVFHDDFIDSVESFFWEHYTLRELVSFSKESIGGEVQIFSEYPEQRHFEKNHDFLDILCADLEMMTKGIPFLPSAISLVMKQLPNVMQEQNLQSSESHKDKGPGKKLALKKMATEVWKEFRKEKFQDQLSLFSERFVLEYDEKAGRTTFSKKTALELRIKYLRDIYGSIKSPKEWNFIRQQAPESEIKAVHEIESHFPTFKKIVSKDPAINHIKIQLAHNARFGNDGLDVLLMGETGTGKELFAEAVHEATQKASKRKGEYRRVNCAAISETLLESELFGHKKGTFTGAKENRDGYFKVANGGTLLLDEVGELSLNSQAKLLRVIQQREIQTVGASKPEKIDVVVVFATNKNLKEMVKQGKFREDLYHRINSYTYVIPPLRERKHDIPILIEYFITKFDTQRGENLQIEPLQVTEQCMEYFTKHQWPGNVRELENIVRRIVRERREGERRNIELAELPDELVEEVRKDKGTEAEDLTQENLPGSQKVTDDQIKVWMEKLGGDKSKVARKLGVTYKTILRHCQKLGI